MKSIYNTYNKLVNFLYLGRTCMNTAREKWADEQRGLQKKKLKCPTKIKKDTQSKLKKYEQKQWKTQSNQKKN